MDKENQLSDAIEAALDKKALDAVVLELGQLCSFTDYFLVCTGTSSRHIQSIADNIEEVLKRQGIRLVLVAPVGQPRGMGERVSCRDLVDGGVAGQVSGSVVFDQRPIVVQKTCL